MWGLCRYIPVWDGKCGFNRRLRLEVERVWSQREVQVDTHPYIGSGTDYLTTVPLPAPVSGPLIIIMATPPPPGPERVISQVCVPAGYSTPHATSHTACPANTRHTANVVLMMDRRRRRWANIKTILDKRLLFAGCPPVCPLYANIWPITLATSQPQMQ